MDQSRASDIFDVSASMSQQQQQSHQLESRDGGSFPREERVRELLQQFEYCAERKKFIEVKERRTAKKACQVSSDELDEVGRSEQVIYVVGREKQASGLRAIDSGMLQGLLGLWFNVFWALGSLLYFGNRSFEGRAALSGSCG